jgi:hypothetical protein
MLKDSSLRGVLACAPIHSLPEEGIQIGTKSKTFTIPLGLPKSIA